MTQQDKKVLVRVPDEIWGWINNRCWHNSDYEIFKDLDLPAATKVVRALLLLYRWFQHIPAYMERKGSRVVLEFEDEGQAMAFCAMLARNKKKEQG